MTYWNWLEILAWSGVVVALWALWMRVRLLEVQMRRRCRREERAALCIEGVYKDIGIIAAVTDAHSVCLDDQALDLTELKGRLGVPVGDELVPLVWRLQRGEEN